MKRIITYLLAVFALAMNVKAETVSQKEASMIAQTFFNAANGQVMAKPNLVYNGRRLTTDRLFSPFYIYNHPSGGYVIISAENKAFPILGYNLKESFDPERINDNLRALLTRYAKDIEYIRHDERVPEEAIKGWTDINGYIANLLNGNKIATDVLSSWDDVKEIVKNFETTGRLDELSSDLYYPYQWEEFVDNALIKDGNVTIGLINNDKLYPAVIHGSKGDYYRISFGEQDETYLKLMATEFFSYGQVADFGIEVPEDIIEEDEPFILTEEFMAETAGENEMRQLMLEEKLHPTTSRLQNIGGGRYQIYLPEDAYISRIYNLSGNLVNQQSYRGQNTVVLNLEGLPYGFYVVLVNGESGRPYEFKVSR